MATSLQNKKMASRFKNLLSYVLSIFLFVGFILWVVSRQITPLDFTRLYEYTSLFREGFINTIIVSFIALVGSMMTGFLLFLMGKSKIQFFRAFVDVFTEIIYGTPLLVMIMVMAFLIGPSFNIMNRPVMGVTAIIIYITPYMSNIFKSAFSSITEEQYMAMELFRFNAIQKYVYIIIPQVIRILMPPLMNNFSLIIKGSALLNVLSYRELFYSYRLFQSETFQTSVGLLFMWILYIIITIPLSQFTRYFERRWSLQ